MWYLQLPTIAVLLLSLVIPALLAMLAFYLVRRAWPNEPTEDVKSAANWGAFRIGSVHAFIIALAFTGADSAHGILRETVDQEAVALRQLYRGVEAIESDSRDAVLNDIASYTRYLIDVEWPSLAQGRPLVEADLMIDSIRGKITDLARVEKGIVIPDILFEHINDADDARSKRVFDISLYEPSSNVFWFVVIVTLFATTLCFFVYAPTLASYSIIGVFVGVNGVIFFTMLDYNRPFEGIARVEPFAIETVYQRTMQRDRAQHEAEAAQGCCHRGWSRSGARAPSINICAMPRTFAASGHGPAQSDPTSGSGALIAFDLPAPVNRLESKAVGAVESNHHLGATTCKGKCATC